MDRFPLRHYPGVAVMITNNYCNVSPCKVLSFCSLLISLLTIIISPFWGYADLPEAQSSANIISSNPLAEPVETLFIFEDTVTMTVTDITYFGVHLCITNDSEFDIYIFARAASWHHWTHATPIQREYRNISLDYFDGESWRNIPRPEETFTGEPMIDPGRFDPFFGEVRAAMVPIDIPPFAAATESHLLTWINPDNLPEPGERLFRVRKDIHADRTMNLARLWRVYYARHQEEGEGIWRGVPTVIRHTLVAEFYWDGQIPARLLNPT